MRGESMAAIDRIRALVANEQYEFAIPHFFEEMADDELIFEDIETVIATGMVRRRFTRDPRGTRYEVVGETADGRLAAVICRIKTTGTLLFITTYTLED